MASVTLRHVIRGRLIVPCNLIWTCKSVGFKYSGVRLLYSAQFLGIDKYLEQRERVIGQFGDMRGKFVSRMLQYINNQAHSMIFTEDLKNMVFLADDSSEDMEICVKMMKRFNQQNKELRFGTFVFGPVAMRLFHYLNKPDVALQLLKDQDLDGFFDQFSSYHIAMDLLFTNGYYQDVIDVYEQLRKKQLYGTRYPRECVCLTMASCYKLNTPESYKYSIELIQSAREVGANIIRKALAFVAALALNQNDPKMAMEVLALTPQLNYITVKNLKLIALAELDRLDDVFAILRSVVSQDSPTHSKTESEISQEALDRIQKTVDRLKDKEAAHIFEQTCRALKENNHVNTMSLDELLTTTVQAKFQDQEWNTLTGSGSLYGSPRRPSRSSPLGHPPRPPSRLSLRQRQGIRDADE